MTIATGVVSRYLVRYLDNSDAKTGSAMSRPIVPPRNFRKGRAVVFNGGVLRRSGSAYLTE